MLNKNLNLTTHRKLFLIYACALFLIHSKNHIFKKAGDISEIRYHTTHLPETMKKNKPEINV